MRIPSVSICSFLFFLCVCGPSFAASSATPTDELKPTLEGIMAVLTDPAYEGLDKKENRRNTIMAIAKKGFDFRMMSKMVLGSIWNNIDSKEQEYFQQLFTKLLENAYIGKLEDYSGQVTKYEGEQIRGDKAEVRTLVMNNGVTLPVNYIMVNNDSGWQVYDIKIEGVRLLRNYQAQFKSIVRQEKFDGLIKVLEEKNATFTKEGIKS
jgi:phospholipid transport system substrate-binding protein